MGNGRFLLLLPVLLAGCSGSEEGDKAAVSTPVRTGAAVELVTNTFYPRLESEDFWEVIPLAEVGSHFLLRIHPRIETPAEGPWTITFRDPAGKPVAREVGLRVDTATGEFTFLCASDSFRPGDWTILLEVPEPGMIAGPRERPYRFRVE